MKKIAIVSDFSKTLTAASNPTTWSVFAKSGILGNDYIEERNALFEEFHHYELSGDILKTEQWWKAHMDLFIKYKLSYEDIQNIVKNSQYFNKREGLKELFNFIQGENFTTHIVSSSGITNIAKTFLEYNNIETKHIKIIGNFLHFDEQGDTVAYSEDVYTSLYKGSVTSEDVQNADHVILLGDDESDLNMYEGRNCIKFGFCDSKTIGYDVYLGKQGSLTEIISYINTL